MIFNVSKEAASQLLWVSTRTIDRYISAGKLNSKKVGNKVMLSQQEVIGLRSESDNIETSSIDIIQDYYTGNTDMVAQNTESISKLMDEKFDTFMELIKDKDSLIEDKNNFIFGLQKKIWELESKLWTMIALPDYANEKQEIINQKMELQNRLEIAQKTIRKEEVKNNVFIWLLVAVGIIIALLLLWN